MPEPGAAPTIRRMLPTDAESVQGLCNQLGYTPSLDHVRRSIADFASRPSTQAAFVACLPPGGTESPEVVGWIEISLVHHLQTPPHALIGGLVVQDGLRSHGIGQLLCDRAEAWAWSLGVDTVRVTSRSTRDAAHRFYLRNGYTHEKTSFVFRKSRPNSTPAT